MTSKSVEIVPPAHRQGNGIPSAAKLWELRTSIALAQVWQTQGKRQDAHDLLAPVYDWFTEGYETSDLRDAKALLEELE